MTGTTCGTFDAEANTYIDDCSQASITNFRFLVPEQMIEWDQTTSTFYSGQNITLLWNTNKFDVNELLTFTYIGVGGTRTLGSNINNTLGQLKIKLSDSNNAPATNVYILATPSSSTQLAANSTSTISFIQSKVMSVDAKKNSTFGNMTSLTTQTTIGGDEVRVEWRGLGTAALPYPGGVNVALRRWSGGGGGTTFAQTWLNGGANTTTNFTIPLSITTNTGFYFTITVYTYGPSSYTANSGFFNINAAPSPSPTSSSTPSNTPSPSSSPTSTRSASSSRTPTPSPSQTATSTVSASPTISLSPSTTETARPSIDIAAIARAAQSLNGDSNIGVTIGAVLGTAVAMVGAFLGYHLYQRRKLTQARLRKLKDSARWASSARESYLGKGDEEAATGLAPPQMVVYQVNMSNTPTNSLTGRANYPPQQTSGQYRQPTGRGNGKRV